ncbi:MAG: hypothetical protein J7M21_05865 [Planctomycetes bacterium]|nr:hypothetical protein [Planctomycetota bacterium]
MSRRDKRRSTPAGPGRLARLLATWTHLAAAQRRSVLVWAAWLAVGVLFVVGAVAGMRQLHDHVLHSRYSGLHGRAYVQLTRAPAWMPASLARRIVADLTPPQATLADRQLARKVYRRALANPWVRRVGRVEIRPFTHRPGGIVAAELEFRRPVARVCNGAGDLFVDADGVRLPETQVPIWAVTWRDRRGAVRQTCYLTARAVPAAWRAAARRIHYVRILGVESAPPPPGWRWKAPDLATGLRLVGLLRDRPYFNQITLVDVRNYGGRITSREPQLRLYAQVGRGRPTEIRFGRFPAPDGADYVISPQRKLSYLDEYASRHGGLLAGLNSYLDLRFDQLHVSIQ